MAKDAKVKNIEVEREGGKYLSERVNYCKGGGK